MESFMKEFEHLKIHLEDLKKATNNFGSKVIGVGGFGKVYEGEISHSKGRSLVAIKRLSREFGQGDPEFLKEIMMLSRYSHENLITLLGYCDEDGEKILVYEHSSNGSLDRHLSSNVLTWPQRLKICLDAAKGLEYLHDHRGTQQRILHRDVKSANILLDDNWNAKLSDMGLSKVGPANQQHSVLITNLVGTPGYCDPQYMETYMLSKESDIYSFGVVLFEVLCGKLCFRYTNDRLEVLVPLWKQSYIDKNLDQIIFKDLRQSMDPTSFETFSEIAFQCLYYSREQRPTTSLLVQKLEIALKCQERHDMKLTNVVGKYSKGEEVFFNIGKTSNNVVNYDEKVMDGFYDVYGIASNAVTQGKMPSLVDLQARTIHDDVDYEVILVDRRIDKELQILEERVSNISLECKASGMSQIISRLVQRVANIVVGHMGGPVSDADEMLRRWTARSYELRNSLKTIVLPLGSIDCGLSRHRALLFKVLADKINLACSLAKGSYYTGTDDGAVNFIKLDNGSEYIIDLMGAPGTLIPVEVPCCNFQSIEAGGANFGYTVPLLDISSNPLMVTAELDNLTKVDSSDLAVASIISSQLSSKGGTAVERKQTERFENDFGKLLPALVRPHEGLPGGGNGGRTRTSSAQKSQLNDVSQCVINAAKHPDFAQKLHAVLSSDSLINVNNKEVGETEGREIVHLLDADMLTFGGQDGSSLGVSSNEQNLISFTEAEISNVNDNSQLVVSGPLINEARADNIKKSKNLDPSSSNNREGISLDEVEWEIPWEDLQIGARIGIGSYGEVYRSEWNGTEVAVKKFMNQDISGDALTQFKGEVEIMLRLRHPNVVLFMGAVTRPPNLSILTEFLPRGSLFKLLHRSNGQLDERRRMRMALDVAKGMNYLHASNPIIVHRDLKTPNLLVDKNWVVKVCDFGMSKSTAGTPEWMAPEVLRNEPSNEKCNVYSFGVILWELATLRIPWTEMNSMQVVGAVGFQFRHLDIPEHVDPAAAQIILDCWHLEPQSRPSFKEIISRLRSLRHLSTDRPKNQTS